MHRVTGSPWIADFRCWTFPEVAILDTDQKECGLWGRECFLWNFSSVLKWENLTSLSWVYIDSPYQFPSGAYDWEPPYCWLQLLVWEMQAPVHGMGSWCHNFFSHHLKLLFFLWEPWIQVLAIPCWRGLTRPKQLSMAGNILSLIFFGSYRVKFLYHCRLCALSFCGYNLPFHSAFLRLVPRTWY